VAATRSVIGPTIRKAPASPARSLIAMPLIGWSMLSAGGYPIVFYGSIHLPKIAPHNDELYAFLRGTHTILAFVSFATILLHVGAALFHALIRRDGVFPSITGQWSG
jgi:cytochrome b561